MNTRWFRIAAVAALASPFAVGSTATPGGGYGSAVPGPTNYSPEAFLTSPGRSVSRIEPTDLQSNALNINGYPDFAERVQHSEADPSPGPGRSRIDNYINQDEQVNIGPNDEIVRVIRTNQKNLIQQYVTKLIPMQNVSIREIRGAFRTVTGKEGGRAEVVRDKVKKVYFLQVIAPEWQIPFIEKAAHALDEAWVSEWDDGSADLYYKAKFRDAVEVNRIAKEYGGTQQVIAFDTTNNAVLYQDEPYRIEQYMEAAKLVDVPEHQIHLEGAIYELNLGNDLKLGLDYIAWKNGPGRNLFQFVMAGEHSHEDFRNASSIFNPATLGIAGGRILNIDVPGGGITERFSAHAASRQEYAAANFLLTAAYFDFLQSKGVAKVLNRPSITTKSGTIGTWTSVDHIVSLENGDLSNPNGSPDDDNITLNPGSQGSIPNTNFLSENGNLSPGEIGEPGELIVSGSTRTTTHNRVLRYRSSGHTGLFLSILPMIGTETTELTIDFAASDLNGTTPQGTPILNTRTLLTTVRVADDMPFVVGGIRRTEKAKFKQGAPWLSAIPVLGWAFGGESKIDRETDVAIVLTPDIYTGSESDTAIPQEAQTTIAQAKGEAALPLPRNPFGFDQWLLEDLDR